MYSYVRWSTPAVTVTVTMTVTLTVLGVGGSFGRDATKIRHGARERAQHPGPPPSLSSTLLSYCPTYLTHCYYAPSPPPPPPPPPHSPTVIMYPLIRSCLLLCTLSLDLVCCRICLIVSLHLLLCTSPLTSPCSLVDYC